ncbi:RNA polymerase subunit sigma-70 [Actinocrispum sp. NPDC049592]|uniref:RNA polymerase subunit sigma-70 n=1 Tax=Actinocrispum sp. NPDC049592 TaxID=3154835 RepID=UPI00341CD66D
MPPEFTVTEQFRPELLAHCYRLLGSIHDAEDLVQETYLRAWRGFDRFEGRSSVRRWLYKIATTACLTALETRSRRPLPSGLGAPSSDHQITLAAREPAVPWLQPAPFDPDTFASVRLAFVAALQYLPARQRAVLTLRDVLAFSTAEVAEILDTTVAAVDSALRRARTRLAEAGPVEEDLAEPSATAQQTLLNNYVDAFTRADPGALITLLRADVELEMPPTPTWFTGRTAVLGFLTTHVLRPTLWHLTATYANAQPALIVGKHTDAGLTPYGIQVLTLVGPHIARITAFNDPALVPAFAGQPTGSGRRGGNVALSRDRDPGSD